MFYLELRKCVCLLHYFSDLSGCLETVQPPIQMDKLSVLSEHHNGSISKCKEVKLLTAKFKRV